MIYPERITIRDTTAAGYCVSGTRRWFEAHGLDFADFKRNGIRTEDLLATEDACAEIVVNKTVERLNNG